MVDQLAKPTFRSRYAHASIEMDDRTISRILVASMNLVDATISEPRQSDCAPSEDSDQPGYPPSLIRVFAVRMKKALVISYPLGGQRRLWSDWADAQADLSLRWAHSRFAGFVMSRLIYRLRTDRMIIGWALPCKFRNNRLSTLMRSLFLRLFTRKRALPNKIQTSPDPH